MHDYHRRLHPLRDCLFLTWRNAPVSLYTRPSPACEFEPRSPRPRGFNPKGELTSSSGPGTVSSRLFTTGDSRGDSAFDPAAVAIVPNPNLPRAVMATAPLVACPVCRPPFRSAESSEYSSKPSSSYSSPPPSPPSSSSSISAGASFRRAGA